MTIHKEAQMIIAHWLCGDGDGKPCASHMLDGEIAVRALALAGYLKTDGGAVGSSGAPSPSAGAGASAPPSLLRTPDEWCRLEGVEILDADGWRGRNGRPWEDPITLAEFKTRLVVCTMRHKIGGGAGETPAATSAATRDPAAQAGQAHGAPAPSSPRPFVLQRHADPSGISGTGVVAEGVQFTDGHASLRWRGPHPSTVAWDNVDRIVAVHGHNGATELLWLDGGAS